MDKIKDYGVTGGFSTKDAGSCRWGFGEKNGHEYFIKEFLSPVYPEDNGVLSPKLLQRKRALCEDFERSKRAFYNKLSQCRSGNNIVVEDFFRFNSRYYAVTDRIRGNGTDPALIAACSKDAKETLTRSLLYSVAQFHKAGIVHADIKPNNILLKKTVKGYWTVKIIDFDAGFFENTAQKEIQFDPIYLSPEVFLHGKEEPHPPLSTKIDIFALGILLHQYWCGELPKLGDDYHYCFEAVLDGGKIALSPALPKNIHAMITRMLSLSPDDRPRAQDLLNEFGGGKDGNMLTQETVHKKTPGLYIPDDLG